MASRKVTKSPNQDTDKSVRLTVHLPTEWQVAFETMVTMRQTTLSDLFLTLVQNHLASLSRKESDLIRGMVNAATGKTLRIDRNSADSKSDDDVTGEGQGVTTSPVLSRINRIQDRSVDAPITAALDVMYRDQ